MNLFLSQNKNHLVMKFCIPLLALVFGFQLTMMAQKSKSSHASPKEDIQVNREYDENGNLIKFDSVYSYSWSGDTTLLKSISPEIFSKLFDDQFNFSSDSTFFDNFFFDRFDKSFFGPFSNKKDSIINKNEPYFLHQKSMIDMMKLLQQRMKDMEEHHWKFFKGQPE